MKAAQLRAGFYTRVSSQGQATEDKTSLPEQELLCRELCQREGWKVVEHYQDAGLSATSDSLDTRPAMRRLLRDASAGAFERLVCYHQDRLARNTEAGAQIATVLKLAGVQVLTPDGLMDLNDLQAKLLYYKSRVGAPSKKRRESGIAPCGAGRRRRRKGNG